MDCDGSADSNLPHAFSVHNIFVPRKSRFHMRTAKGWNHNMDGLWPAAIRHNFEKVQSQNKGGVHAECM